MAMEHKAFVFDHNLFAKELAGSLRSALDSGAVDELVSFINTNLDSLKDPYEGEPLDESWESLVSPKDAHQYGDFALTRFYDPTADHGLGPQWEVLEDLLDAELGSGAAIVLGSPFGPAQNPFDPGKAGAYLQTPSQVQQNLRQLRHLSQRKPDLQEQLDEWMEALSRAQEQQKGLYITF